MSNQFIFRIISYPIDQSMNTSHYSSLLIFLLLFTLALSSNAQDAIPQSQPQPTPNIASPSQLGHQDKTMEKPQGAQKIEGHSLTTKASEQVKTVSTVAQDSEPLKISIHENSKQIETLPEPTIETPQESEVAAVTTENGEKITFQIDPLEENVIEKEQRQAQQEEIKKQESKLHPWVAEEFQRLPQTNQIQTHEIFSFQITEQSEFKWNPTQFKSGPLTFVVEVFNYARGDITYPENPEEDDFVEIFSKSEASASYVNLGKVYIKKLFKINFFSDFQMLKIVNHYQKKMFVQISLEATKFVPEKALDDDTLKIPAEKIKSILEELEQTEMKREKTYKSEWSFRDRQQHHQSEMLILTGVELIVILGTAIVQMYCIKNLFDNRLIV